MILRRDVERDRITIRCATAMLHTVCCSIPDKKTPVVAHWTAANPHSLGCPAQKTKKLAETSAHVCYNSARARTREAGAITPSSCYTSLDLAALVPDLFLKLVLDLAVLVLKLAMLVP